MSTARPAALLSTLACAALLWPAAPAEAGSARARAAQGAAPHAVRKAAPSARKKARPSKAASAAAAPIQRANEAEHRLIEVYELFGRGRSAEALAKAGELVRAYPNFQLAQLVYADLLAARVPLPQDRVVPARTDATATAMAELRQEAQRRLQALRERPAPGTVPAQFLSLSQQSRYAIAVDASRSRLYLMENSAQGLKLVADYYISVGKSGLGKLVEGDARTPLGIYHVTSNLDPKGLRAFYGDGALPINYPNAYDARRGKTGSGIWLHGTPPEQFARAPQATDGCVVMANPDLRQLVRKVQVGATPVVIAQRLDWIAPQQAQAQAAGFSQALTAWRDARTQGNLAQLQGFYTPDFQRSGRLAQAAPTLRDEVDKVRGRRISLKDISYLHWKDAGDDTMVTTFGEVIEGEKTGRSRRQYWLRQPGGWKVFHEEITG